MSAGRVEASGGLAAGVVVFVAALSAALSAGHEPFVFDGRHYMNLAWSFGPGGSFSLTNFDSPLRGYSFPLVLRGLEEVRSLASLGEVPAVRTFNAVLLTVVVCVLVPRLVGLAWPRLRFGPSRQLALAAVFLVFWHGHLEWPLSDLPALTAGLAAIVAVGSWRSPGAVALAGGAAALAVNLRPAYLLLVPAIVAILVWNWWEARDDAAPVRILPRLALMAGAIVLVSLPQSLAMSRHFDTWNPLPGAPAKLAALQFSYGLAMQRYDTYIGDEEYPPRLIYADPVGMRLLDLDSPEVRTSVVDGYGAYLRLAVDHPAAIAGSIGRHLVNGLDARYATPYVERLALAPRWPWRVLGFTLVWLALLRLGWPRARRRLGPVRWRYLGALTITCVTALPSAIETRFLLPLCLLAYVIVLLPGWEVPQLRRAPTLRQLRTPAALAASYVVFMGLMWLVAIGASRNLRI